MRLLSTLFLSFCFLVGVAHTGTHQHQDDDPKGIYGLLNRVLPGHANDFMAELIPSAAGKDIFELDHRQGKVVLRGNNHNAMAVALNYYLKYYCHTSVSWYSSAPVELPAVLPSVPHPVRREARVQHRFFLNYCTFGYTMPWWEWKDWERLIDWMALNGINMPLAITGQEAIWYKVWKKLGLSDQQIREYFTGPAHLPWHRMSNIDHLQGPLPASYVDHQLALQKQILRRERELNMVPVLTAFAGHVPLAIRDIYPDAKITGLAWGAFGEEYRAHFLDPFDPLFNTIQRIFLEEQTKQFGTDHLYGADPFNEIKPPRLDSAYLASVSRIIYGSIRQVDPNATWLMMAWIFSFESETWTQERIQAFLSAVPQDKIMLLDYYCEKTEVWRSTSSFFGQPFLWCYLGNFGGNSMLAGNIAEVDKRIEKSIEHAGTNLSGIGSTLEALDNNPIIYEYVFEKAWGGNEASTPSEWIQQWADRRYGKPHPSFRQAWKILLDKIYTDPAALGQATLTNARPALTGHGNWTTDPRIAYSNNDLLMAWKQMISSGAAGARSSYRYDVVNTGRQFLGNYFLSLRDSFTAAYHRKDIGLMKQRRGEMLAVLDDIDKLLSTHDDFLLGNWLKGAEAFGRNKQEKRYYVENAKTIITVWGIRNHSLNDYANRSWAGLVSTYYRERWKMFLDDVISDVKHTREFDADAFHQKVVQFEGQWPTRRDRFPADPVGDTFSVARDIVSKYGK